MMDKHQLRSILRRQRQAFAKDRETTRFFPAPAALERLDAILSDANLVAGYLPVGSEADLRDLMTSYGAKGVKWCLPWLAAKDASMAFRAWLPGESTEIAPGRFEQPLSSRPIVSPDAILLPLVGFDRNGNRLGQGAGHYDRALENLPDARRIGIAWSIQEVDALPADPWDVPLDAILTEAEWIIPPHSRLERA